MSIVNVKKFAEFAGGSKQKIFIDGVAKSEIYSDIGVFKPKTADVIKRFQNNIAVPINSESGVVCIDVPLLDQTEVDNISKLTDEYCLLHFSAILLSITRLFSSTEKIEGRMFLFDARGTKLSTTLKEGFSFDLQKHSRAHYLYCPDYMVSISDGGLQKSLKIRFEFSGVHLEAGSHSFFIDIGVMYRLLNNPDDGLVKSNVQNERFQELQACHRLPNLHNAITFSELRTYENHSLEDIGDRLILQQKKGPLGIQRRTQGRIRRYKANPIPDKFRSSHFKIDNKLDKFIRSNSTRFAEEDSPRISVSALRKFLYDKNVCPGFIERDGSLPAKGISIPQHSGSKQPIGAPSCSRNSTDGGSGSKEEFNNDSLLEESLWKHRQNFSIGQDFILGHGDNSSCSARHTSGARAKLCDHSQSEN
uniref:MP n=1 Tax=Suaeda fruticosa betaflexivirus 1 TaxID=2794407 RepID=A0A7T5QZE1_9VIRU|nr:MP [Suaeda fruticosa betaflexivirus 1]